MPWQPNTGQLPGACRILDQDGNVTGYRSVHVRLFNGYDTMSRGDAPWPGFGSRVPTNWNIDLPPHNFQIKEWILA